MRPFPVTTLQRFSIPAAPPSKKNKIRNQGFVFNHLSNDQPIPAPTNNPASSSVATLEKVLTKVWLLLLTSFLFPFFAKALSILAVSYTHLTLPTKA